ncbi:MAG: hypothetical protein GTO03_10715 [Planctomycetales bacterium]|nr:hypothetical protein [Planctomycetales bacterium]
MRCRAQLWLRSEEVLPRQAVLQAQVLQAQVLQGPLLPQVALWLWRCR